MVRFTVTAGSDEEEIGTYDEFPPPIKKYNFIKNQKIHKISLSALLPCLYPIANAIIKKYSLQSWKIISKI